MYLNKKTVQLFYYEQGAYANFNINKLFIKKKILKCQYYNNLTFTMSYFMIISCLTQMLNFFCDSHKYYHENAIDTQ